MTREEAQQAVAMLAKEASEDQPAVAAVLYALAGSISSGVEQEMGEIASSFSRQMLKRIQARRSLLN